MPQATEADTTNPTRRTNPVKPHSNRGTSPAVRRMFSASVALQRLNDNLQGPARRRLTASESLARIEADIAAQAEASMERVRQTGIERMLSDPWRITRAVNPAVRAVWPMQDADGKARTTDDVLAECRFRIDAEKERAAHWTFDFNRLVALQQAEGALAAMLAGEMVQ